MCKIADLERRPITLVLDNARYQRNAVVQAWAAQLVITLCSCRRTPNLNLIERLWRFTKRRPSTVAPPDVPGLSSRHPRGSRRFVNQVLPATGLVDDAEFPAIRRRLTHGRVKYKLIHPHSKGGFGQVWVARDRELHAMVRSSS